MLGDNVRYDAEPKRYPELVQFIKQHFEFISVCPEVEIGLSVPRPPVQLTGSLTNIKVTGRDDASLDITDAMQTYCQQRPLQLDSIHGYIFKSRSPSCGVSDIPLFNSQNVIIAKTRGVFVSAILQHYPELPIIDEQVLADEQQRELFFTQVKQFQLSNTQNA